MLHFLQPIWLLAFAGIIFPVIIHLWNIREGKTLTIGSISLLVENARQQARSFRLKDILLLILRCLIITSLAVLLAKPVWQKQLHVKDEKGWVLLDKKNINESYSHFKPSIDSLRLAGVEFHYFNKGFEKVNLEEVLKQHTDSSDEELPYWTLLKQLNEKVPADLPIYLFTDQRLSRFKGSRPDLAMDLRWISYTSRDTSSHNIIVARLSIMDSIQAVVAHSTSTALQYEIKNVSPRGSAEFKLRNQSGELLIADTTNTNNTIEVDTGTLTIIIYTDTFLKDADYVEAAIDAIRQFGKYKIQVEVITSLDKLPTNYDWLFWLSTKTIPDTLIKNHVFIYEKGKEKQVQSWINNGNDMAGYHSILLFKQYSINNANVPGKIIWSNGFGEPILSLQKKRSVVYHFYSRFNPAWNDLVWDAYFPQMIFELMLQKKLLYYPNDQRIIDVHQMQPTIITQSNNYFKQKFVKNTDLSKVLWIAAFLLFAIERYISLASKKEVYA